MVGMADSDLFPLLLPTRSVPESNLLFSELFPTLGTALINHGADRSEESPCVEHA